MQSTHSQTHKVHQLSGGVEYFLAATVHMCLSCFRRAKKLKKLPKWTKMNWCNFIGICAMVAYLLKVVRYWWYLTLAFDLDNYSIEYEFCCLKLTARLKVCASQHRPFRRIRGLTVNIFVTQHAIYNWGTALESSTGSLQFLEMSWVRVAII